MDGLGSLNADADGAWTERGGVRADHSSMWVCAMDLSTRAWVFQTVKMEQAKVFYSIG